MTYTTVNGCTHKPSKQQIITIIIYITIICLHAIYIVPGIAKISNAILYILLALHYIALIVIIYDYIWITVHDPVDTLVLDPQLVNSIPVYKLEDCEICGKRQLDSYHCKRCGRCTEDFDHHCKFLNNCIGCKNYQNFLRLLSINMIYLSIVIFQGIWVFVQAQKQPQIKQSIPNSHWVILGIIIVSGALLILQAILLGFHCYISCLDLTTLSYIRRDDHHYQQQGTGSKIKQFRNSIIQYDNIEGVYKKDQPLSSSRNLKQGNNNAYQEQKNKSNFINPEHKKDDLSKY